jgi:hypothetical protein
MLTLLLVALLANGLQPPAPRAENLDQAFERLSSRRTEQIERIRRYAAAGNFPRNLDFPGELVPYFIDAAGTPCAVGHLMLCDGWTKTVAGIVESDNHVRIENIDGGSVKKWARSSGLTLAECALIQPSYACIEDYRQGREWIGEVQRLQDHFAKVEKRLIDQTTTSLAESLAAEVDRRLKENPGDPAFSLAALLKSLRSDEPAVRIAAARALAHESLAASPKGPRIEALRKSLEDADPAVRFWSAEALRRIGSAAVDSPYYRYVGPTNAETQINALTGPVFLATWREGPPELRHAALVQIAHVAPESIASSKQMRWVPEARRVMVEACDDKDAAIAAFAQERLKTFRWQRIAYESQRMQRQYRAETFDEETLAAEVALLGMHFAPESEIVSRIEALRTSHDHLQSMVYLFPNAAELPIVAAATPVDARRKLEAELTRMYRQNNNDPPTQQFVAASLDESGLFFDLYYLGNEDASLPIHYIVPTLEMLKQSNMPPQKWTQSRQSSAGLGFQFKEGIEVTLGPKAISTSKDFESACDLLASFLVYHSRVVVTRETSIDDDSFVWSGRIANGMLHRDAGSWTFQQVEFRCDRDSGRLKVSTTPLPISPEKPPALDLDPDWTIAKKRRMGWAPLPGIDFYGEELFPPEYVSLVERFDPASEPDFRDRNALRRFLIEEGLPAPAFLLAMLYAKHDRVDQENLCLRRVSYECLSPRLADVAQWQLKRGRLDEARGIANSCLKNWPGLPAATEVLRRLDAAETQKR